MYLCADDKIKPLYRPGLERWSSYKRLWIRHWHGFLASYNTLFEEKYGLLTADRIEESEKLIRCGKFANGFRLHACPECGTILAVPFTCKSRLCLSCYRKRLFGWSVNLSHIMNTGLEHFHVTLTLPGGLRKLLFERKLPVHDLMNVAAGSIRRILKAAAAVHGAEWTNGMIVTLHPCGNGLNYNPHVHLISTRELVNMRTGELISPHFLPYAAARIKWMKTSLRYLVKKGCLSSHEAEDFTACFPKGFHVHFKPIRGNENDVLFKTAEYLGAGIFHNSQIEEVNHEEATVTFKFRRWIDRHTKEKMYAVQTMPIYEFMARMLFYLPERHLKTVRYYGFYAHGIDEKLGMIRKKAWAFAINHSFSTDPEICPRCRIPMIDGVVFSFEAERKMRAIVSTHLLVKGYFIPIHGP